MVPATQVLLRDYVSLLSSQMSEACNLQENWWDLSWHAMYDFDNMSREEDQSFFVSFSKAQFSLLHVLSENFGTHEKQSIGDHDLAVLVEKYQREYSEQWDAKFGFFPFKEGWSPTNWMTTRLPFGHMCLQTIARKASDFEKPAEFQKQHSNPGSPSAIGECHHQAPAKRLYR